MKILIFLYFIPGEERQNVTQYLTTEQVKACNIELKIIQLRKIGDIAFDGEKLYGITDDGKAFLTEIQLQSVINSSNQLNSQG